MVSRLAAVVAALILIATRATRVCACALAIGAACILTQWLCLGTHFRLVASLGFAIAFCILAVGSSLLCLYCGLCYVRALKPPGDR